MGYTHMKKLILTAAIGEHEQLRPLTYPFLKAYATKTHADFCSVEELTKTNSPLLEKIASINEGLSNYDQIISLDSDLIVRPDCPDLFKLVPLNKLAAYNEGLNCRNSEEITTRYLSITAVQHAYGLPSLLVDYLGHIDGKLAIKKDRFNYYNTGVLVCSRQHAPIFELPPDGDVENIQMPEQSYLNWQILKYKPEMWDMPVCFNQMAWNCSPNYLDCTFIIHYAGTSMEIRVPMMCSDIEGLRKRGWEIPPIDPDL
jgi:hypothetical protein